MKHVTQIGSNQYTYITLHGTGGSASDLFGLVDYIDPDASKIGFQGEVNENGMSRYFARYPDGSFDLDSLSKATSDLHITVNEIIDKYKLENHTLTILGYSNGANLAKNLMKEYRNLDINNIILFHPSPITPNKVFKEQKNLKVLMTSGQNDPYITRNQFNELENKMNDAKIHVETFTHNQGHQLIQEELDFAKEFLINLAESSNNDKT